MAKLRVRSKNCPTNPKKMLDSKKRVFRLKCWIVLLAGLNVIQLIINNCL